MSIFCQRLYHRKCQHRGVGGQKNPQNLVNGVYERPLILPYFERRLVKHHQTILAGKVTFTRSKSTLIFKNPAVDNTTMTFQKSFPVN